MPQQSNCCELQVLEIEFSDSQKKYCHLYLESPGWNYTVGQFVMLKAASFGMELALGRPLSICALNSCCLHLFFQVLGEGTDRLARLRPGDEVTVWGPLGTGFRYTDDQSLLLLAGGIGIAPFFELAQTHPSPERLTFLFGHQPDAAVYPLHFFSRLGKSIIFHQNLPGDLRVFIELLDKEMADAALKGRLALACGPLPFLKTVQRLALEYNVNTQVSLETRMGCGMGACLGCVVESGNQRVQTCTRGPVFWADEISL